MHLLHTLQIIYNKCEKNTYAMGKKCKKTNRQAMINKCIERRSCQGHVFLNSVNCFPKEGMKKKGREPTWTPDNIKIGWKRPITWELWGELIDVLLSDWWQKIWMSTERPYNWKYRSAADRGHGTPHLPTRSRSVGISSSLPWSFHFKGK
jgi:hypothetical protein